MIAVLLVLLLLAVVALLAWWSRPEEPELDEATCRAATELHAIRRRLEVASFKAGLRADAARLRRELYGELARLEEDERLSAGRRRDRS